MLAQRLSGFLKRLAMPGIVIAMVVLWFASGLFVDTETGEANAPSASVAPARAAATVRTRWSYAQERRTEVLIRGQTRADDKVVIRAETQGKVIRARDKGDYARAGAIVCALSLEARAAQRSEAEALKRLRFIELEAAKTLVASGHRARTGLAAARAAYEGAEARLRQIEIEISRTSIRAPFDGILADVPVKPGDYLTLGAPCATLVDLNPLLIAGHASQRERSRLAPGRAGYAILFDGTRLEGKIHYVAPNADSRTRTFLMELIVPNKGARVPEGVSATIYIPSDPVPAHRLPSGILTLDDAGRVGVRVIEGSDTVRFRPVAIIQSDTDAVWVSGLRKKEQVIVVGQDYVADGVRAQVHVQGDMIQTRADSTTGAGL